MSDTTQLEGSLSEDLNLTESPDGPEVARSGEFPRWMAQLPDEFKSHKGLSQFKTIGELAGAYLDRESAEPGERLENVEGEPTEASPIPTSPEGYQLQLPDFPEELQGKDYAAYRKDLQAYLEGSAEEIKALAHETGLSNETAQRVADFFAQKQYQAVQAAVQAEVDNKTQALEDLRKDWKGKFEANQEVARRAIQAFGGDALVNRLGERGLANDAVIVETFFEVGKAMGEDTLVPGSHSSEGGGDTKQQSLQDRYDKSPELFKS